MLLIPKKLQLEPVLQMSYFQKQQLFVVDLLVLPYKLLLPLLLSKINGELK